MFSLTLFRFQKSQFTSLFWLYRNQTCTCTVQILPKLSFVLCLGRARFPCFRSHTILFYVLFTSFIELMRDMLGHLYLQEKWTFSKRNLSLYLSAGGLLFFK